MAESKTQEAGSADIVEVSLADTPFVVAGYGETAKREGAKTKDVHNVSPRLLTKLQTVGRAVLTCILGRTLCSH